MEFDAEMVGKHAGCTCTSLLDGRAHIIRCRASRPCQRCPRLAEGSSPRIPTPLLNATLQPLQHVWRLLLPAAPAAQRHRPTRCLQQQPKQQHHQKQGPTRVVQMHLMNRQSPRLQGDSGTNIDMCNQALLASIRQMPCRTMCSSRLFYCIRTKQAVAQSHPAKRRALASARSTTQHHRLTCSQNQGQVVLLLDDEAAQLHICPAHRCRPGDEINDGRELRA